MNRIAPQDFRQTCYAVMASDDLRAASSSGGAFTILAREVLARGGAVCGAAFDESFRCRCEVAEDPCMADIGILASTDPVAIDQACLDLIYAAKDDPGQAHFIERVETRHGVHTIEAAAELGFGTREYELVEV